MIIEWYFSNERTRSIPSTERNDGYLELIPFLLLIKMSNGYDLVAECGGKCRADARNTVLVDSRTRCRAVYIHKLGLLCGGE